MAVDQNELFLQPFEKKGREYWQKLKEALAQNGRVDRNTEHQYAQRYTTTFKAVQSLPANIADFAGKPGDYVLAETTPKGAKEVAYSNYLNAKAGIIIASYNYAIKDVTEDDPTGKGRLNNSEILWHQYREAAVQAHLQAPTPLTEIVRSSIQNEDTMRVMTAGMAVKDRWQESMREPGTPAFLRLLGTDNCKAAAFLLADHTQAFQRRTITRIVIKGASYIRIKIGA